MVDFPIKTVTIAATDVWSDGVKPAGARVDDIPADDAPTETSTTTDGTEQILIEKDYSVAGTSLRLEGIIDASAMIAGDQITVREYMTVAAAGAYKKYAENVYPYAFIASTPAILVMTAWTTRKIKVTIQRTAGADHAYPSSWKVGRVA